jgi:uncharacterized protein
MPTNLLHLETSPYLLQHKDNPVHWRPWGPDALAAAHEQDRPILLSIGYAACHWCHVMAHESFEDPDTAAVMNELFVNIKVDREERPDIDRIYMSALHHLGDQGGWPLTMFLTPDGEPFWGGTYFPKAAGYGRPAFTNVLREVARIYREDRDKVDQNRAALRDALNAPPRPDAEFTPTLDLLDDFAARLVDAVDPVNGGLTGAPKFPQTIVFSLLWRSWLRTGNRLARNAVVTTLQHICQGGIYDHLGGGFARYSVDHRWLAPHFEKMLYDNALLIELMTLVWQDTGDRLFETRIAETVAWIEREMIAEGGGFAASLDADSEGEEGRFYVWSKAEIDAALGAAAPAFARVYDVTGSGNWEGTNILNRLHGLDLFDDDTERTLADNRQTLLDLRARRVRPGWDDKVLVDWNGLMIAALAFAAPVFSRDDWLATAAHAFRFVCESMADGPRLHHSYRVGRALHLANADGYANMIKAAIALYEATADETYVRHAETWTQTLLAEFWDDDHGGLYFTAAQAETLIARTRSANDDAVPNANATTVANLARLFAHTGNTAYRERADRILRGFAGDMKINLFAHAGLLSAFETLVATTQVVIVGEPDADDGRALYAESLRHSIADRMLSRLADTSSLPPGHPAAGKAMVNGRATAYVCRGTTCSLPVTERNRLAEILKRPASS